MRFISERNAYVRVNRHLDDHGTGQKLRKVRTRSANAADRYYLENPDGLIAENVELEKLARRLGCLEKHEKIGVPSKRTGAEANALLDELASEMAASKVVKKQIARDLAEFTRLASRFED
jgi:hypothetical protein